MSNISRREFLKLGLLSCGNFIVLKLIPIKHISNLDSDNYFGFPLKFPFKFRNKYTQYLPYTSKG